MILAEHKRKSLKGYKILEQRIFDQKYSKRVADFPKRKPIRLAKPKALPVTEIWPSGVTYFVSDEKILGVEITIDELKKVHFKEGDKICLQRGKIYNFGGFVLTTNNLTFSAYGAGDDPIIRGSQDEGGSTWTDEGGGIYSTPVAVGENLKWVFKDGVASRLGETDWIVITSTPTSFSRGANTATLNAFNSVQSLVGAKVRAKEFAFRMSYEHNITAYNDGTGVFTTTEQFSGATNNYPFKIHGQQQFCTVNGDWYYDEVAEKLYVRGASSPAGSDIRICTEDYAFYLNGCTGVTFTGLEITQFYRTAIETFRASDTLIDRCDINHIRTNGLWLKGNCTGLTVTDTTITRCGLNAIAMGALIDYNYINVQGNDIGEESNIGWPIDTTWRKHGGVGISVSDEATEAQKLPSGGTVSGCEFFNLGYQGIGPYGSDWLIENTHIYNFSRKFEDGGGIHTFDRDDFGAGECTGTINNCIIHDGVGSHEGIASYISPSLVSGVYIDNGVHSWTINECTIYGNPNAGIHSNWNTELTTITDNIIYDNGRQVVFFEVPDAGSSPNYLRNKKNVMTGNTLVCTDLTQFAVEVISTGSSSDASYNPFDDGGNCDNNYYVSPFWKTTVQHFRSSVTGFGGYTNISFADWKTRISDDAASTLKLFNVDVLLYTNTTASPVNQPLSGGVFESAAGAAITELNIPAYSGALAIQTATTYYLREGFNDADATSMAAKAPEEGNNANVLGGTHTVTGGVMVSSVSGLISWNATTPNYIFERIINVTSVSSVMRMDLRYADNTTSVTHRLLLDFTANTIRLREWNDSGSVTNTWTAAYIIATGRHKIRIIANGASIQVYVDGVLLLDETTGVLTGNWVVIYGESSVSTAENVVVYSI